MPSKASPSVLFSGRRVPQARLITGGASSHKNSFSGGGLSAEWVNKTTNFQNNLTVTGGRIDRHPNGSANLVVHQSKFGMVRKDTSTSVKVGTLQGVDFTAHADGDNGYKTISDGTGTVTALSTNGFAFITATYLSVPHTWVLGKTFLAFPTQSATAHYYILAVVTIAGSVITKIEQYWTGGRFIYHQHSSTGTYLVAGDVSIP